MDGYAAVKPAAKNGRKREITNLMTQFQIVTLAERPDLLDTLLTIQQSAYPEFLMHEAVSVRYWHQLMIEWPHYQLALLDLAKDSIAASGHGIPLHWVGDIRQLPDTGWDWALQSGMSHQAGSEERNVLCALSIAILPEYRGVGISQQMVAGIKKIGSEQGFERLIIPVRPNLKPIYPLIPMQNYVQWTNREGLPFDAWLRVHVRSGAKLVKVCPRSMTVTGSVTDWEQWTDMRFPESGLYTINGALVPLKIMQEQDKGLYVEPNVWVVYDLGKNG